MAITPVFLPRELHGQRSLVGYSSWDCKELDMNEQLIHLCIDTISIWACHVVTDEEKNDKIWPQLEAKRVCSNGEVEEVNRTKFIF